MTAIILVKIIIILTAIIIRILLLIVLLITAAIVVLLATPVFVLVLEELVDFLNQPIVLDWILVVISEHVAPHNTLFLLIMLGIDFTHRHFLLSTRLVYTFEFTLLQISLLCNATGSFFAVLLPSNSVSLWVERCRVVVQTLLGWMVILLFHIFTFATERILLRLSRH